MAATRQPPSKPTAGFLGGSGGSAQGGPAAAGGGGAPAHEVAGPARLGRRTKLLVRRLRAGEIAVIDHRDLDRVSAEDLIAAGVAAVLNCKPCTSGRYPNLGPQLLVEAGILLVELPDDRLFGLASDGDQLIVRVWPHGARAEVHGRGRALADGRVLSADRVRADTEARKREIGQALERFANNTIEHMREERELLAGRIDLPRFRTDFRDRPALVVVRGVDRERDLRALRAFIRDTHPALIGVDGGADALLAVGLRPDMIVGDMDSASERALLCGRDGRTELVVHCYPDGSAPGRERLQLLGLSHKLVPAPGMSQDVAMLIAAEKGARLIVSVGSQFNLVEFLDRDRQGMSSTFLTRLRVGEILIDAKGVSRLYRPLPGLMPLLVVVLAGVAAIVAIVWSTPLLRDLLELLLRKLGL
ncbi:MAG TPA: putative cytokinetic ring protein SteA [Solirubrobacteraceae bacterium]|jgi:uncharacterized membrane-anchored protein|nr:putative cytokinetic ring protein SteA [Solirubrobacteraceae bacterium]